MTIQVDGRSQAGHAAWLGRKHGDAAAQPAAAVTATQSAPASSPAADPTGIQGFATELQSFLLSLQSGQAATSTTANAASTAATASTDATASTGTTASTGVTASTGATDSMGVTAPIKSVADRLQTLLSNLAGDSPAATASQQTSGTPAVQPPSGTAETLSSALDKLQATLTQALQTYGMAAQGGGTTNIMS